ncbi:hypothetical protein COB57_04630 [Candidatus Peregrinibacteria bacterium]|nr:MAG: hypothetical protein COB57_04630 [Candidatus Peregrinibacteria bacterium]
MTHIPLPQQFAQALSHSGISLEDQKSLMADIKNWDKDQLLKIYEILLQGAQTKDLLVKDLEQKKKVFLQEFQEKVRKL